MHKIWYLVLLFVLTLGMTFVEVLSVLKGYEVQNSTVLLWKISFFILTILWVKEDLNTIVSLSRSSWWRMNFKLAVGNKTYQLRQRALETELIANEGKVRFYTISGLEFYKKSSKVTTINTESLMSEKHVVEINEKDHCLALLAATCLESSSVTKNG